MRKKNAGALYMDFHVSPEDRVGATPKKGTRSERSAPAKKAARGARIEPGFSDDDIHVDDERQERTERAPRGKAPRGRAPKSKKGRGRRERRPLTLFGVIWKLI